MSPCNALIPIACDDAFEVAFSAFFTSNSNSSGVLSPSFFLAANKEITSTPSKAPIVPPSGSSLPRPYM